MLVMLYVVRAIGKTRNVQHVIVFFQRERFITYYLPRRLGADVANSLVTFSISEWLRPHQIVPETLIVSLSI